MEADFAEATWDISNYLSNDIPVKETVSTADSNIEMSDLELIHSKDVFKSIIEDHINNILNGNVGVKIDCDNGGRDMVRRRVIDNIVTNKNVEVVGFTVDWHRGMDTDIICLFQTADVFVPDNRYTPYERHRPKSLHADHTPNNISASTIDSYTNAIHANSFDETRDVVPNGVTQFNPEIEYNPQTISVIGKPKSTDYSIIIEVLYATTVKGQLVYTKVKFMTNLMNKNFRSLIENSEQEDAFFQLFQMEYVEIDRADDAVHFFADIFGLDEAEMINYKKTNKKLKKKLAK